MSVAVITSQSSSDDFTPGGSISLQAAWSGIYGSEAVVEWYKNGALLNVISPWSQSRTSSDPPDPPIGSSQIQVAESEATDGGAYVFRIYSTDPDTGYVESKPIVLKPPTILDRIEIQMVALVMGIRKSDGYNFDWGMVNEQDESIGAFPRCVVDPSDSIADKESNQDTLAGVGSLDYTNEVIFTLLVKGELPSFETNPLFAVRSILRQAQDDLKRLFGIHLNLDGECDNIMYSGSQIESLVRNDVQRPAQLRTFWKVVYSQDRTDPTKYASS